MPDWPDSFQRQTAETPHGRFAVWRGGEGPALWCLHGFPDTAETWRDVAPQLAAAGYRVHVLQMPGYSVDCLQADYRLSALADTIVMVMESLCPGEPLRLVGHDWGAALAQVISNQRPEQVEVQVMAAVPHLRRFLQPSAEQFRRSWYMAFFQLLWAPERRIQRDDFAFIERLWRDWSPGWNYSEQDIAPVKRALAEPRVVHGALAYYRAMVPSLLRSLLPGAGVELRPCPVPTLAIAGADDGCIGIEMFAGQQRYFTGTYQFCRLEQAGHFMHREQPEAFVAAVLEFLA